MWGAIVAISPTWPHRFEGQIGLGYWSEDSKSSDGSNQKIRWTRFPLEAMYYYHNTQEHFRVGWGYTQHLRNDFTEKATGRTRGININETGGWTFAVELTYPELEEYRRQVGTKNRKPWVSSIGIKHHMYDYKEADYFDESKGSSTFLTLSFFGFD